MNLGIQWHITELCNWRCTHCYHDQYLDEGPSLQKLKDIFDEILEIDSNFFGQITKRIINFQGGEPLMRKDFILLLEYINSKVDYLKIGIFTNGSLLDEQFLNRLKELKNLSVWFQISIEGREKINDEIRGKGTFKIIEQKIALLKDKGFYIHLSLTLTNKNKGEVFKLIPFIKKHDIKINVRRLVPMGQSKEEYDLLLSAEEWYKFSVKVFNINNTILQKNNGKIGLNLCSELTSYKYNGSGCLINEHRILIIMHNLDILSCRKLPIVLGNLNDKKLKEIFLGEKYLEQVQSSEKIDLCNKCPYYTWCKGGAKCITYAKEKTLIKEDPQCYFAKLLKKK